MFSPTSSSPETTANFPTPAYSFFMKKATFGELFGEQKDPPIISMNSKGRILVIGGNARLAVLQSFDFIKKYNQKMVCLKLIKLEDREFETGWKCSKEIKVVNSFLECHLNLPPKIKKVLYETFQEETRNKDSMLTPQERLRFQVQIIRAQFSKEELNEMISRPSKRTLAMAWLKVQKFMAEKVPEKSSCPCWWLLWQNVHGHPI